MRVHPKALFPLIIIAIIIPFVAAAAEETEDSFHDTVIPHLQKQH